MPRKALAAIVWFASNLACVQGTVTSPADTASLESEVAGAGATDPGPRGGPLGAGGPLAGLSADEQNFFAAARVRFQEKQSVSGSIDHEDSSGLGPTFNGNSFAACHVQHALG